MLRTTVSQVEAIGVLGNLAIDNFNYQKLLEYYDLLAFMSDLLVPQAADDDIVLEAVRSFWEPGGGLGG